MDLSNFGLAELRALAQQINKEIKRRESEEISQARQQILAIAQSIGIPLKDLVGVGPKVQSKAIGKKVAVKYRHPENPSLCWTGRGRQPNWIAAWEKAGGAMAQLRVTK